MPTDPVTGRWLAPPDRDAEEEKVVSWRREELERAGYCQEQADAIACRLDVDLHQAVELLKGGCPIKLALGILL
jgi:hypothetical protein